MSMPLSLDHLAKINAAISEYKYAKAAVDEAAKLVPLKDKQTVNVGKPSYDNRFYPEAIEVPLSVIRSLLAERAKLAGQRLAQARRILAQLNVETPA